MNNQPKVTIDEKDYLIDNPSDEAKDQLGSFKVTERNVANLD
jgi:hypothetical protein